MRLTVGMGLLVHYSAPDDTEMANGVATLTGNSVHLVSQLGAVSVTNPEGNSIPEEIIGRRLDQLYLEVARPSNLVPVGERVMTWPNDYDSLARMLFLVADAYAASNSKPGVVLDFEYKKLQPGVLDVKQVREVPSPLVNTQQIAPYMLSERRLFMSLQPSYGDLPAAHRLKSRWTFESRNVQLTASNLLDGFFADAVVEWIGHNGIVSNRLAGFSNFTHRVEPDLDGTPRSIYSWQMDLAAGAASCRLVLRQDFHSVLLQESPFFGLEDLRPVFIAEYQQPVWTIPDGVFASNATDLVTLVVDETNSPVEVLQILGYEGASGSSNVTINSKYYIPNNHIYAGEGPLLRFEETRITGLTSRPMVLRGFFSQSWVGDHRQANEWLFEPHLEEGIDPVLLQELEAKNIRIIYLHKNREEGRYKLITFNTDAGTVP